VLAVLGLDMYEKWLADYSCVEPEDSVNFGTGGESMAVPPQAS